MKQIYLIIALLLGFGVFAQKEVAEKVNQLVAQGTIFNNYSILTPNASSTDNNVNRIVEDATMAKLNVEAVNEITTKKQDYLELEIPYQANKLIVQLYKVNIFSEGFHIDSKQSKAIQYQKGVYYRGIIKGDRNSIVSFNFFENECNGLISNSRLNNLVVGKLNKKGNKTDYIVYSDQNLKITNNAECHFKDELTKKIEKKVLGTSKNESKCVSMYFEIDNDLYLVNNSDVTTTTNWMTSVFNNVQTIFANDGIKVAIKSLYIWTEKDPYTGPKSADYLYQFSEIRPVFDGDVGQLIAIDPNSLGGVAYGVNELCSNYKFSYSDVDFSYQTVPTFSWTVMVITHEMGHLLGSEHTHACVWNGNNTAIDNCAPVHIGETSEGYSCLTSPPTLPSSTEKGTIMSYCHLISEIGINLANGFGPQPKAAIQEAISNSNCLSTDCINTCINMISAIQITNISNTTASITWTEDGDNTSWQISVEPLNSSNLNWSTVTSNSFSATNLLPDTFYKIVIRSNCDSGLESPQKESIFVTNTNYCDGVVITDTGGINGNYSNSESYVRTIIPNVADKKVKLNFTSFDLEKDYDYLYVYDGNSTSATDLSNGGFTGTTIPETFISTASDGSLTIEFYSDGNTVSSGYIANVACESNLENKKFIHNIDFTYSPNPSNGIVSISSQTLINEVSVYNIQGQLLYQSKINGLDTKVNMTSFAIGTYFFKLKFDEKEVNFKILKK